MAKHKPSVALFEVIHAAKAKQQHQKSAGAMLRTPNWWFKGKSEHLADQAAETFAAGEPAEKMPAVPSHHSATPAARTDVFAFDAAHADVDPAHEFAPATPLFPSAKKLETPFDHPHVEESNPFAITTARPPASMPAAIVDDSAHTLDGLVFTDTTPASYATPMKVDRDHQKVVFNLSYTAAIIGATAVFVVVAVAFIVGRVGLRPSVTPPANSDLVQITKPRPDVLNNLRNAAAVSGGDRATIVTGNDAPKVVPAGNAKNAGRVVGLQYVIIQSYRADDTLASEAVDLLAKNGVQATVEKGLPGWGPTWFSVVGTQSFERTRNNTDYDAYVAKIKVLSDKYAGASRLRRFEPVAYKWVGK